MSPRDLDRWEILGVPSSPLLAVGWLGSSSEPVQQSADTELVEALVKMLVDPWQPALLLGRHRCQFCLYTGGPSTFTFRGTEVQLGRNNLFVPGGDRAYVSPSLILHYMDSHGYAPPHEFRQAALACPPMKSLEYLKRIRSLGLHTLRPPVTLVP